MDDVWIEKYRPKKLDEVTGQDDVVERLKAYVKTHSLPHLLFAGPAGTGKTSCALALAKEMFGEGWKQNFQEMNASDERGIQVVRTKIKDFARTAPIGETNFKIIFLDEADRVRLLETLGEACGKTDWQVHAYCLMRNHYHVVLETPNANLVAGMAWLQSTYTIRFNHRHKLSGHLFSGRYKSQVVEGSQAKADRIIAEELSRMGWSEKDLALHRKGDPAKLALAARLRNETTLSLKEIAARLHLGKSKGAKTNLLKWMHGHTPEDSAQGTLGI